ncbi:P-loop ATPase, Sll1717 family [Paraburkholderia fungorum]|uniref:P-loop ATPase, Sll1717 family n=1 Tax=Paraburkholderia fungorum TaxID=134537 RepID=UPI00248ED74B|nr:hypothetical protein [Paraburkholderia fungorum]
MDFDQYYKSLGLIEYPFGVYTTEAETGKFSLIYLKPSNHSVVIEGLRNTSAIVVGERGTGKTALSLDAGQALSAGNNLIVRIEDFSSLAEGYAAENLYRFLIQRVAAAFFDKQAEHPTHLWRYSKNERIDLSMYLHEYLTSSSKSQLRDKINKIQNGIIKRTLVGTYNACRVALNYGLKAATKVLSDALTKHFSSLPAFDSGDAEYFKRIESEIDDNFTVEDRQFFYLEKLCRLIGKGGIEKIYIIIDKIDEDTRLKNDAESISDYIKNMASDNKILTSDLFHVLLFFWSTPFNYIKGSVRTQKLTYQQLEWTRSELESVMSKRLSAYSDGKLQRFDDIFSGLSSQNIDLIFEMCNKNPRDLWHIINKCFTEQFRIDSSKKIGDEAVSAAIEKFVTEFNYYEYYPKKANAKSNSMDVYSYMKHLLKLDATSFTKDKLNTMAGTGSSTANYVVGMENMGLVRKTLEKGQGGAVVYEINDPKVRYAMRQKIVIGS